MLIVLIEHELRQVDFWQGLAVFNGTQFIEWFVVSLKFKQNPRC